MTVKIWGMPVVDRAADSQLSLFCDAVLSEKKFAGEDAIFSMVVHGVMVPVS